MLLFWIVSITMMLLAIWFVISSLIGKVQLGDSDQDKQNILIAKEQLTDIEKEYRDGVLSESEYRSLKDELQQALISNVSEIDIENSSAKKSQPLPYRFALLAAILIIPGLSIPVYFELGNSEIIDMHARQAQSQHAGIKGTHTSGMQDSMDDLINNLALRLEKNPENIKGWSMLGRSYMSMRRFQQAADAYAQLYSRVGDNTEVLLSYADALAMSRHGKISGMPFQLVMTALKQEPNNTTALWLAGLGYAEKNEYEEAIKTWEKLLPLFSGDVQSEKKVKHLIEQANIKLTGKPVTTSAPVVVKKTASPLPYINVTVSLSDQFKNKVNKDDLVFIYAKATQGPPMPLAAIRKRVSDLPVTVRLDDSMAMMPQMKLSAFPEVNVGARISKSGSPIGQSGDFQGIAEFVTVGVATEVAIIINAVK